MYVIPRIAALLVFGLCALLSGCDAGGMSDTDGGAPPGTDAGRVDGSVDGAVGRDAGPTPGPDAGPPSDAGRPPSGDAGPPPPPPPGWPESRGWTYVRNNPMFISALTARMGVPPASAVNRYFDDFGANAIHLWETALPTELDGWLMHRPGAPWLTWVHSDGTNVGNGMVIGGYRAGAPGRIGYQVGDEPRTAADMTQILGGLAAVRTADPDGLRVVNFSYADALDGGFVDRLCATDLADVISYDLYSRRNGHYRPLAYFRDAGLRCGMPYWRYIKSYIADSESVQSESDMRWAALGGLVYGYTGHSWFLYLVGGGDAEGIPTTLFTGTEDWTSPTTERFGWARQLNREMAVYGRALTQLLSTDIGWATDTPISGVHPPEGAPLFRADMDPYLSGIDLDGRFVDALFGFFIDRAGDRYVMVQNPNHTNGSFPTDDDAPLRGTLRFDFSGASGVDPTRLLVLDGRTGAVRTQAVTGGAVPVDLAAGDVLFFKYDTGRTFAGY